MSVNWNSRLGFFLQLYKLLRRNGEQWETGNYGLQRKGNCIIKRHPCTFPLFECRQTSTHLTKNIHILRAIPFFYTYPLLPPPPSPLLTKFSEEVLKNGTPAGCRTEEKISIGEVKEKQIYVYEHIFLTAFFRLRIYSVSTAILPGSAMMQLIGWIPLLTKIISQWFSSQTFLYHASFSG